MCCSRYLSKVKLYIIKLIHPFIVTTLNAIKGQYSSFVCSLRFANEPKVLSIMLYLFFFSTDFTKFRSNLTLLRLVKMLFLRTFQRYIDVHSSLRCLNMFSKDVSFHSNNIKFDISQYSSFAYSIRFANEPKICQCVKHKFAFDWSPKFVQILHFLNRRYLISNIYWFQHYIMAKIFH